MSAGSRLMLTRRISSSSRSVGLVSCVHRRVLVAFPSYVLLSTRSSRPSEGFNGPVFSPPTRFYARDSGLLKFKIQAGLLGRPVNHAVRRLVAFTFHPFEPFAISVQRTNAEYVVNFHMRCA